MWIRTCQECGHKQEDKKPNGEMTPAYMDRKCKWCKSSGLNYGSEQSANTVPEHGE